MQKTTLFLLLVSCHVLDAINVSFDNRAIVVDGKRTLLIAGSIHYPRAHSSEWPHILNEAKENGINLIQTYVV